MRCQSSHKERQNEVSRLHVIVSLVVVALVFFIFFDLVTCKEFV